MSRGSTEEGGLEQFFGALLASGCEDDAFETIVSPDGRSKAVLFSRDCGAMSSANLQLSILPVADQVAGAGNVLGLDIAHLTNWATPDGSVRVQVRWIDDQNVEIEYPNAAHAINRLERVGVLNVHYRTR